MWAAACEIRRSSAIEAESGADDVKQKAISKLFEAAALSRVFLFPGLSDKK